jgi:hypothetical protein
MLRFAITPRFARRFAGGFAPRFARGFARLSCACTLACALPAGSRSPARPTSKPADHAATTWSYEVQLDDAGELSVAASFSCGLEGRLVVADGAERFVDDVTVTDRLGSRAIASQSAAWPVSCAAPCRVRYRFRLREAALALDDVDLALPVEAAWLAPPSTWLLHPDAADGGERFRFHVATPTGQRFVTGIRSAPDGAANTFEADVVRAVESSFAAFGDFAVYELPESRTTLAIAHGIGVSDDALLAWTRREIAAISGYLGTAKQQPVLVLLIAGRSQSTQGETLGGGGASLLIRLGERARTAKLDEDWVLPHELIHARLPYVARTHAWFSEGLASYVEPIARVRAGLLSEQKFWRDMLDGMPQGLPEANDPGLENTASWGRVYWGGALYFLLADLEIREHTNGLHSLEDALRAVVETGANVEVMWPLAQILEVGDNATGTHVLHALYQRLGLAGGSEDLERLWSQLGVVRAGSSVRFEDQAPLAAVRRSLTAQRSAR